MKEIKSDISEMNEEQLLQALDFERIPKHIAFIMDGNGRWATKQGYPRVMGHIQGRETVQTVVRACLDLKISVVTFYTFSVENWKRPKEEVDALMQLIEASIREDIEELDEKNVRFNVLGRIEELPQSLRDEIHLEMDRTRNNTAMTANLAINYGGRTEIVDAARKIAIDVKNGLLSPEDISEELISKSLYTADLPDPDLIIRTAGERRISNYLLWQIAYAELWVTPVLWPDFGKKELYQSIYDFQHRVRKFGGVLK